MKINFKSKKLIILLVALLGGTTTVGIIAANIGGNDGASNPPSSSTNSSNSTSQSSLASSNEEQVIRDFQFSDARFNTSAYPANFQPFRFIDDGLGGFYGAGYLRTGLNQSTSVPSIVRANEDFTSEWVFELDFGQEEGTSYQDIGPNTFYHGALLDNGNLLVFGQIQGFLLLTDGSTRIALTGVFQGENIPTTTSQVAFYGIITPTGVFTMIDYILADANNTGDFYISDVFSLDNDEFIIVGRTGYTTKIFEGVQLNGRDFTIFIAHLAYDNQTLTTTHIESFNTSGNLSINRSFLHEDLLVFSGSATGSMEGYPELDYPLTTRYPLLIAFNISSMEVEWMTTDDSLKIVDFSNQDKFLNTGNIIMGHDNTFFAIIQHRSNSNTIFTTFLLELSLLGMLIETKTLGEIDTNSTFFIGRTESGYFTLGNTSATTGEYASAGNIDILLTITDRDFEVTSFEVWGGENGDGMASWPTVLNSGILIFASFTSSATGNLAEALEKTDTTPTNFLIILS